MLIYERLEISLEMSTNIYWSTRNSEFWRKRTYYFAIQNDIILQKNALFNSSLWQINKNVSLTNNS